LLLQDHERKFHFALINAILNAMLFFYQPREVWQIHSPHFQQVWKRIAWCKVNETRDKEQGSRDKKQGQEEDAKIILNFTL
jgi:hypothetical protein